MLKSVTIGNFQSFSVPMEFELNKLNLIYGANSNGKSSFFRALKLLSTNIQDSLSRSDLDWSFNAQDLTLQSFANCVNQNDESKVIHFGLSYSVRCVSKKYSQNPEIPLVRREIFKIKQQLRDVSMAPEIRAEFVEKVKEVTERLNKIRTANTFDLPIQIEMGIESPGNLSYLYLTVDEFLNPDSGELEEAKTIRFKRVRVGESLEWDFEDQVNKYGDIGKIRNLLEYLNDPISRSLFQNGDDSNDVVANLDIKPPSKLDPEIEQKALKTTYVVFGNGGGIEISGGESYPAPTDLQGIYSSVNAFIDSLWRSLHKELRNLEYVGPLREIPPLAISKNSWFNELNIRDKSGLTIRSKRFKVAKDWFEKLTDGEYGFEFNELTIDGKPSGYSALQVTSGNFKTNLQNVGVGISQVLPVVFSLFGATTSSRMSKILLIEQPELHLHPKLQSELADAIIAASLEIPERQIFIETHSENLLLRFLRRIREVHLGKSNGQKVFSNREISLLYVERTVQGAQVARLQISKSGEMLDPWPLDFVDIRLDDVL